MGEKHQHRELKGPVCEDCGFIPVHPCQLEVDHVDGDHTNDDPENRRTRCANCHRLKTFLSRDWEKRASD